jgi:hypothetical protein
LIPSRFNDQFVTAFESNSAPIFSWLLKSPYACRQPCRHWLRESVAAHPARKYTRTRLITQWRDSLIIVQPETVLRWPRAAFLTQVWR